MRFAFIDAEKARFPVVVQCEVLEVSRSGFYAWRARRPSARATQDARLAVTIVAAHKASKRRYGSPRIHRALRQRGVRLGKKRVERLMRSAGLVTKPEAALSTHHRFGARPADCFRTCWRGTSSRRAPNVAWAGYVTYIATDEGWAHLAVLLDLFSRRVVGWAMSAINDTELALAALQSAVERRRVPLVGLVQHTDRGQPVR